MTKDEALQMCLEYIETNAHERKYVRHAIKQALADHTEDNLEMVAPVAHIVGDIDHAGKVWTPAQPAPVQEPFAWCIESEDSADWCFAKTEEGVKSNSVLMDEDCIKTKPFPIYTTPPAAIKQDLTTAPAAQPAPVQEPVAWRYDLKHAGSFAGVSREYSPIKLSIGENWTPLYTTSPAAPVQEPVQRWAVFCGGCRKEWSVHYQHPGKSICAECEAKCKTTPPAAPVQDNDHEFKNFHRQLCERFGYTHDEVDWKRDQISLIEWIAKQVKPAAPVQEPVAWMHVMDNTEGIKANGKGIVSITQKRKHPFGKPGVDFSKSYPVTSTPLYTTPPAAPVQKPVACVQDLDEVKRKHLVYEKNMDWKDPLYTTPPAAQRQWVGLTDEEIDAFEKGSLNRLALCCAIEAKLKERNNG